MSLACILALSTIVLKMYVQHLFRTKCDKCQCHIDKFGGALSIEHIQTTQTKFATPKRITELVRMQSKIV